MNLSYFLKYLILIWQCYSKKHFLIENNNYWTIDFDMKPWLI